MENYRLELSETESGDGISADLYDDEGLIAESTRATYADYGLAPDREGDGPGPVVREFTADVRTHEVQYARDDGGFEFRVLGDGDELARARVDDEEWRLGDA